MITLIVSEWGKERKVMGPSQVSKVSGDYSHVAFGKKKFPCERKCEMVHCHDAVVNSFDDVFWDSTPHGSS
jgi:hypothetical protein